ncbi:DUF333 domain-containing protein [Enterobacter cancerogenus]|uniref:DUF333 domain-containing protein n=1 Tax=Enterobacter cancerogenus TaxID=69218 RepID=A0ABX8KHV4_9ENTR|nr:DUF333 domain-containing protein [Enterobacter cancerogenus]QXA48659.1 DUF333 domain-containing protein [Enterobacter cancerogenus]
MKKAVIAASVILVAGCTSSQKQEKPIGMANPASVHCIKQGGKLDIVKESRGEVGYCTLPSGERIEEWALFRRDNMK